MTGKMRVRRNLKCKTDLYFFFFFAAVLFINVDNSGGSLFKDCQDPLIGGRDDQMSSFSATSIHPSSVQPRLSDGWCPTSPKQYGDDHIQVDLRIQVNITGIATRGCEESWVKDYHLYYSNDGSSWITHKEPGEPHQSLLTANRDPETFVVYRFEKMERARHVKIRPNLYQGSGSCCFRFELFGCDGGMRNAVGLNEARIGPKSGMYPQSHGELWDTAYSYKSVDRSFGWSPGNSMINHIKYQLITTGIHLLSGFLIQGCTIRKCPPGKTEFSVRNLTLNSQGDYDTGRYKYLKYRGSWWFPVKEPLLRDKRKSVVYMLSEPIAANEFELKLFFSQEKDEFCRGSSYGFCVQIEFYGKDLDCKTPLGLEWSNHHPHGAVKDDQMSASSEDINYSAHVGRLKHKYAWCADQSMLEDPISAKSQFLQIDFLKLKRITGVSTQGLGSGSVVTNYYLYYATDPDAFHSFRRGENNEIVLFQGDNGIAHKPHTNWLDHPFVARYIRFSPQNWIKSPCLRVEVYGCDAECSSPLGMECGLIENHQIKASSETTKNKKHWGRLNSVGWCVSGEVLSSVASGEVLYHFLQIDLMEPHLIRGVATQGKEAQNPDDPKERPEAVTSFYLKYSFEGDEWFRYHKLLVGEYYSNSVMRYWLEPTLAARFIEFNPQTSWSPMHICMRVEVYGCPIKNLADVANYLSLGMESFRISDVQLSASSQADASHSAVYSRLNQHIEGGAWIPEKLDKSEYLQIDLGWAMILTGIATQGHPDKQYRALTYKISHVIALDQPFTYYPKEFVGNVQEGSTEYETLNSTQCRYVRIYPLSWSEKVALRAELYGFEAECYNRLGVNSSSGQLLFSASSSAKLSLPGYSHLHSGLGTGAWCAEKQDANQYLQVDLREEVVVTGVATQGQKYSDNWVLYFTLAYSLGGRSWNDYTGVDVAKRVFTGNKDRDTAVLHFFVSPLVTRYLRFQPQTWNNNSCMRVGIYGCAFSVSVCNSCSSDARCIRYNDETDICVCNHGFVGDGKSCKDWDECSSNTNPCQENAECVNTVGSYRCYCKKGFTGSGGFSACVDVDECDNKSKCPPNSRCINTVGSFKCECAVGLISDPNNITCVDIDECTNGNFKCHPHASCVNTHGSYSCLCDKGYTGSGKVTCVDVNECKEEPSPCDKGIVCKNTKGSYQCSCETGFIMESDQCVDDDECRSGLSKCPLHSDCVNTIGSYICNCKQGFYSNGPYCVDFNECLSNRHKCDVNARCTNTAGSYKCFCKEGYHGNGIRCEKDFSL